MHGGTHVGDAKPGESRTHTMIAVGRTVGDAGRTISTGDIAHVIDHAKGSPEPSTRKLAPGQTANSLRGGIPTHTPSMAERRAAQARLEQSRRDRAGIKGPPVKPYKPPTDAALRQAEKHGLAFGAPAESHGGFKVGDTVRYGTPSRVQGRGPVTVTQQPGVHEVVGLQRNGNLRLKHPVNGTTVDVNHKYAQHARPVQASAATAVFGSLLEGAVLSERFVSQDKRSELAKKGHALHVDGRDIFPIASAKDAENAAGLWLSGHHKTPDAKAHILKNARRVGATGVVAQLGGS